MKNLIPLRRKISYWDSIVSCKQTPDRISLETLRHAVETRFDVYGNHATRKNFETIALSPFNDPDDALLRSCYSKTNGLSSLKDKIKTTQGVSLMAECQYCNIGPPETFDHYLPQDKFPEYSALSTNLLPCCPRCNTLKGVKWLDNGCRMILHLYFDDLPNIQYLNCNIIYKKNVPQAIYSLDLTALPAYSQTIIKNHFFNLDLLRRFNSRSKSEIDDVFDAIVPHNGQFNRAQIQQSIRDTAGGMQMRRGINYWRAICRIALANSNVFLTSAGF